MVLTLSFQVKQDAGGCRKIETALKRPGRPVGTWRPGGPVSSVRQVAAGVGEPVEAFSCRSAAARYIRSLSAYSVCGMWRSDSHAVASVRYVAHGRADRAKSSRQSPLGVPRPSSKPYSCFSTRSCRSLSARAAWLGIRSATRASSARSIARRGGLRSRRQPQRRRPRPSARAPLPIRADRGYHALVRREQPLTAVQTPGTTHLTIWRPSCQPK